MDVHLAGAEYDKFQHTAARRRLDQRAGQEELDLMFQHTAARRRLALHPQAHHSDIRFQHTAARRRLVTSTTSAGTTSPCFNTQPPEGGWAGRADNWRGFARFNTQPPEGGWLKYKLLHNLLTEFQHTAARRRLEIRPCRRKAMASFNTQPPEGGWFCPGNTTNASGFCFNTQPPEGGWIFHSAIICFPITLLFQHTAARRRLGHPCDERQSDLQCFNTQPPEGGWWRCGH